MLKKIYSEIKNDLGIEFTDTFNRINNGHKLDNDLQNLFSSSNQLLKELHINNEKK